MAKKKTPSSKSKAPWEAPLSKLFPVAPPTSADWTEVEDIRLILSAIADEEWITTLLTPWRGTSDCLRDVRIEKGFLELLGQRAIYALEPVRLEFDYFPDSPGTSYFRLLTSKHPAARNLSATSSKNVKWGDETLERQEAEAGAFAFFPAMSRYPRSMHRNKDYQSSKPRSKFRELAKNPQLRSKDQ